MMTTSRFPGKRWVFPILTIFVSAVLSAQTIQPCVVKQYNRENAKTPLPGVEVLVGNAGSQVSDARGELTLQFRTLKPGDQVTLIAARKEGFEVMNTEAVEQWRISRDQRPFEVVMVGSAYFAQLKGRLKQASSDSYKAKYQRVVKELDAEKEAGRLKEEEYNRRYDELESRYQNQMANLDKYIEQFARIDLGTVSPDELQLLSLVERGNVDEAVEKYEKLGFGDRLREARESRALLAGVRSRIEGEISRQDSLINDLKVKQKREIATLKLAGGEESFAKIDRMLRENAVADSTDYDAIWEYASFSFDQKEFATAEEFYKKALRNRARLFEEGAEEYRHDLATMQMNLGVLYLSTGSVTNAEKYLLAALESFEALYEQNPDASRESLSNTLLNLGTLYHGLGNSAKAEEFFLKALNHCQTLYDQQPDLHHLRELSSLQSNLGILYNQAGSFADAEKYHLLAMEGRKELFRQDPETYRPDLAMSKTGLGSYYMQTKNQSKAEKYLMEAMEDYEAMHKSNPRAFLPELTVAQQNLGKFYISIKKYKKAEDLLLKSLENGEELYARDPALNAVYPAMSYVCLSALYLSTLKLKKAGEALEKYEKLMGEIEGNFGDFMNQAEEMNKQP